MRMHRGVARAALTMMAVGLVACLDSIVKPLGPENQEEVENTPDSFRRLRVRSPTGVTFAGPDLYVLDTYPGGTAIWKPCSCSSKREPTVGQSSRTTSPR